MVRKYLQPSGPSRIYKVVLEAWEDDEWLHNYRSVNILTEGDAEAAIEGALDFAEENGDKGRKLRATEVRILAQSDWVV